MLNENIVFDGSGQKKAMRATLLITSVTTFIHERKNNNGPGQSILEGYVVQEAEEEGVLSEFHCKFRDWRCNGSENSASGIPQIRLH